MPSNKSIFAPTPKFKIIKWGQFIQYSWWKEAISQRHNSMESYLYFKVASPQERHDMISTYCAGGEL